MSDYTPTTGQVRHGYSISDGGLNDTWLREDAEGRFDRWLAEHDLKVSERVWAEGHKTAWKRGPSGCKCYAYSSSECGCGKYGTGVLLSLNDNPYRKEDN